MGMDANGRSHAPLQLRWWIKPDKVLSHNLPCPTAVLQIDVSQSSSDGIVSLSLLWSDFKEAI
jgi:hypothetical protein